MNWLRPGRDPEALIKEARRRQHRRCLAIGLAGLAVAATVAGSLLGGAGHSRQRSAPRPRISAVHPARPVKARPSAPLILAGTDTAVLLWPVGYPAFTAGGGPPAYLDNLTTGKLAVTGRPAISAGDFQPLLITVGRYLVYVGDGTMVIRGDLRGQPRALAKTPFFLPSAVPGQVWLGDLQSPHSSRHIARLASVTGGPLGPPVTLPPDTQMVRGTDGGLLLENFSGQRLWSGVVESRQRVTGAALQTGSFRWLRRQRSAGRVRHRMHQPERLNVRVLRCLPHAADL